MIPPDGLHTNADYPPEVPVLSTLRKVTDYGPPCDFDRVFWVTILRPKLIAEGNLIETEDMKKEYRKVIREQTRPIITPVPPAPLTKAFRTPAGDFLPPVDRKSLTAGENDDQPEAGCPF